MSASTIGPQDVGLAIVLLGVVLGASWAVRRAIKPLARLFIPAAVVGGFLVLLVGPQVLGTLTGTQGLVPAAVVEVWRTLPGLLINVVFAAILIGKTLPTVRELWASSAPHVILGSVLSFGQFALGGAAVLFLLNPVFGLPHQAGAVLEMAFAGGHGTIAGMGDLLVDSGAPEVVDIGLGLATISMITGIVVGTALVRYGMRSTSVTMVRTAPIGPDEDHDIDHVSVPPVDDRAPEGTGIHSSTFAFAAIAAAIGIAIVLLVAMRWLAGLAGSDVFDKFPLFPLAVIGGFVVQAVASKTGLARMIDKRAVDGIGAIALDALLVCAVGTMSLATIGSNLPAVVTFTVIGVGWSVVAFVVLGRRIHRTHWFERSLADFGQSQGNVATGFVLADMADPDRRTSTANDYGYKQLAYEPLLGGGLLTALAVPAILGWGLGVFTAAAAVVTALLVVWGIRRR